MQRLLLLLCVLLCASAALCCACSASAKAEAESFEKLLLYYGYPADINGSKTIAEAVDIYRGYDLVILGDGYCDPAHPVYRNTEAVFHRLRASAPGTRIAGYVPIGALEGIPRSNLSMDALKKRVDQWRALGVQGIFLDEFGYDFRVTRARQNEIVNYCHSQGLFVMVNSWQPDYAFGTENLTLDWLEDFSPNPEECAPVLGPRDYYLYENLFYEAVQTGGEASVRCGSLLRIGGVADYFLAATEDGRTRYARYGTKLCCLDSIPSAFDDAQRAQLQTITLIGAAIFGIHAVGFGDESWGATGFCAEWELPELAPFGISGGEIAVETLRCTYDGEQLYLPRKWSTRTGSRLYSLVCSADRRDGVSWEGEALYAAIDGQHIENLWNTEAE